MPTLTEADLERFWDKVEVRGPDDCWEWKAYCILKGYGTIGKGPLKYFAHRWAYYITYGVDPGDKCVCHSCDNPPCCNPAHLWLGTPGDNNRDCHGKGRASTSRALGEEHGRAKLTRQDIKRIRASKEFQYVLAERYGVCQQLISRIQRREIWSHIA